MSRVTVDSEDQFGRDEESFECPAACLLDTQSENVLNERPNHRDGTQHDRTRMNDHEGVIRNRNHPPLGKDMP